MIERGSGRGPEGPDEWRSRRDRAGAMWHPVGMAAREDCKHYVMQSNVAGDRLERCRVDAAEGPVFSCPPSCLFFEPRGVSQAGWIQARRPGPPGTSSGPA